MSTDIHTFVEYKNDKGKWVIAAPYIVYCGKCDGKESCEQCYDAFQICNGVKPNYLKDILSGGESNSINPIINGRSGFPTDMSDEVLKFYEKDKEIGFIYYDHSYYTLKELIDYDWDQTVCIPDFYRNTQIITTPKKWCTDFHDILMKNLIEFANKNGVHPDNVRVLFCYF